MTTDGPTAVRSTDVLGKGKVVLFAVPGAFTPRLFQAPPASFVEGGAALKADKGVDTIACVAVNDVFVMDAWGKDQGVGDGILMLADGNAEFTTALGLTLDAAATASASARSATRRCCRTAWCRASWSTSRAWISPPARTCPLTI